jgi:colicin import membrane protein
MIRASFIVVAAILSACTPLTKNTLSNSTSAAPLIQKDTGGGYAARIISAIKPNISISDNVPDHLLAEIEIHTEPGGRVTEYHLTQSSGSPIFDHAVLRAVARTERLPLDIEGKVPPILFITFRPR